MAPAWSVSGGGEYDRDHLAASSGNAHASGAMAGSAAGGRGRNRGWIWLRMTMMQRPGTTRAKGFRSLDDLCKDFNSRLCSLPGGSTSAKAAGASPLGPPHLAQSVAQLLSASSPSPGAQLSAPHLAPRRTGERALSGSVQQVVADVQPLATLGPALDSDEASISYAERLLHNTAVAVAVHALEDSPYEAPCRELPKVGVLKKLFREKGFGFIAPEGCQSADVFLHFSDLSNGGSEDMVTGIALQFEGEVDPISGKMRARNATRLWPSDTLALSQQLLDAETLAAKSAGAPPTSAPGNHAVRHGEAIAATTAACAKTRDRAPATATNTTSQIVATKDLDSSRFYGLSRMLACLDAMRAAGQLSGRPKSFKIRTLHIPWYLDEDPYLHDDESLLAALEARLSKESGADAHNHDTFGEDSHGWSYEEACNANSGLSALAASAWWQDAGTYACGSYDGTYDACRGYDYDDCCAESLLNEQALDDCGGQQVALLVEELSDRSPLARGSAARALAALLATGGARTAEVALAHRVPEAVTALLSDPAAGDEARRAATGALITLLDVGGPQAHAAAAAAGAISALQKVLAEEDARIEELATAIDDQDTTAASAAGAAFGEVGTEVVHADCADPESSTISCPTSATCYRRLTFDGDGASAQASECTRSATDSSASAGSDGSFLVEAGPQSIGAASAHQ